MRIKAVFSFILLAIISSTVSASAIADLESGLVAYHQGDCDKALVLWSPLAKNGIPEAENDLGLLYLNGCGVPRDYPTAAQWFREAAQQGLPQAETTLGAMYAEGRGLIKDYGRAFEWFSAAADQGYAEAEYDVGMMYVEGLGVSRNYERALKWFHRAAAQGHTDAQKWEQQLIESGQGLEHLPFPKTYVWPQVG